MKTEHMIYTGAALLLAVLWMQSRNTSQRIDQSGAGGPPVWTMTPGPMGAKYDPVTGTLQMAPLYA